MNARLEESKDNPDCFNPLFANCFLIDTVGCFSYDLSINGETFVYLHLHNPYTVGYKNRPIKKLVTGPDRDFSEFMNNKFRIKNKVWSGFRSFTDVKIGPHTQTLCEIEPGFLIAMSQSTSNYLQKNFEVKRINEGGISQLFFPGDFTLVKTPSGIMLTRIASKLYLEAQKNTDGLCNKTPFEDLCVGGVYLTPHGTVSLLLGFVSTLEFIPSHAPPRSITKGDLSSHQLLQVLVNDRIPLVTDPLPDDFHFRVRENTFRTLWISTDNKVDPIKDLRYLLGYFRRFPVKHRNLIIGSEFAPAKLYSKKLFSSFDFDLYALINDFRDNQNEALYQVISGGNYGERGEAIFKSFHFAQFIMKNIDMLSIVPFGTGARTNDKIMNELKYRFKLYHDEPI